jgi:alkylation response protein AidB-like acyl-CoA dehydrogenase
MDAPGIGKQKIHKIGMDSSDTAQLFFDKVRVPKRHLIGQEGLGFTFQMLQFQEERLYAAAGSLRSLDRLIDQTIDYAAAATGARGARRWRAGPRAGRHPAMRTGRRGGHQGAPCTCT